MNFETTVLIVPPNDAEGVMIKEIAEKIGLPVIISHQLHGASLDKGHDYVQDVVDGGYKEVFVVEMPGVKAEKRFKKLGIKLNIIDHHHYTGLDRAHGPDDKMLPSSLEQFLKLFKLTDVKLKKFGFDPKLVRAIGIQDRGYVWALMAEGYSKSEVKNVLKYMDKLTAHLHNPKTEARKRELAKKAWERRKKWGEFYVVTTRADVQLRPRLSRIIVETIGKPTPIIVVEWGRGLIYVQESPYAMELFNRFGGFTFGLDRNWGHRNEPGAKKVTLRDVKKVIETVQHKAVTSST
ncbi:hypothetical protein HOI18_01305 [Candidatus Uhrbacteria bacterium]|jgi:hypothetical protein|nr:hypothetical protein [Candidatus Uhrbacteria bacterium]